METSLGFHRNPIGDFVPGGIANQETSVGISSDCSGVCAVINARSLCNKHDEFRLCLSDDSIDVCCVTKTWLNNSIHDSFVCAKDYVVYRHARCSVVLAEVQLCLSKMSFVL